MAGRGGRLWSTRTLVASLVAASLMYAFVEQPFRRGFALSLVPGTVLRRGGALLASLILALAGLGIAPDVASADPGASDDPGISLASPTPETSSAAVSPNSTEPKSRCPSAAAPTSGMYFTSRLATNRTRGTAAARASTSNHDTWLPTMMFRPPAR